MANDQYLMDESQVQGNFEPAPEHPPVIPAATPIPPEMPMFFSGSMPPTLQHDTSFVGTKLGTPRIPQHALMPLGIQGNPSTNAGIQSTVIKIVEQNGGSGLALKTNGSQNSNQSVLDLQAGPNIQITNNPSGVTTISGTAGGDGLTHGELPWESDPSYVILRDDFIGFNTTASTIGQLGWTLAGAGNTITQRFTSPGIPNIGAIEIGSGNSAADQGSQIYLGPATSASFLDITNSRVPYLDYPGWKATWVFSLTQAAGTDLTATPFDITKMSLYMGLGTSGTGSFPNRPNIFIGLRYDTDLTAPAINDSTFHLEACFNGISFTVVRENLQGIGGGVFDTGIVPARDVMYRLEISCVTPGQVTVTLNGVGATFNVIQMNTKSDTGNGTVTVGNTSVKFSPSYTGTRTNSTFAFGPGSIVNVSGLTGPPSGANGPNVIHSLINLGLFVARSTNPAATGPGTLNWQMSYYPGMMPFALLANDTVGGNTTAGRCLAIDYFSLIWNPGLTTSGVLPDSTKSRYF